MEDSKEDVVKFIKQITAIPEEFVDDFYQFYNEDTLQTDLVINLDLVAKWLDVDKKVLYRTLKNGRYYKDGIDYVYKGDVPNPQKKVANANNYKYVLISPLCFKHLTMNTHAKKGYMVRTYFIEMDNAFIKYRKQTLAGIEFDMKKLMRNQRPKKRLPVGGYVYVIRASESKNSVVKIGRTESLLKRLRSHNSALADDLEVLYIYKTNNIEAVEKCTHAWLKKYKYRKYKEIYQVDLNIVRNVIQSCGAVEKATMKLEAAKPSQNKMKGGLFMVAMRDGSS
jgi:phage anti-repressor protein